MCYCTEWSGAVESLIEPLSIPSWDGSAMCVFGSREFANAGSPRENAEQVLAWLDDSRLSRPGLIISGGAEGADAAAEALSLLLDVPAVILTVGGPSDNTSFRKEMADERGIPWVVESCTEWGGEYGSAEWGAPLVRNCAMAELTARFDGCGFGVHVDNSPGTARMFTSLEDHGVEDVTRHPYSL
jgi:hypothetical protein